MRYGRIEPLRRQYPIAAMCRVLGVSESGFHAWRGRPPSPRARENARLAVEIKAAHERTRQTYGAERLQADLADHGVTVGVHRIKRIRKELGLACRQKRRFKGHDELPTRFASGAQPAGSAICRGEAEPGVGGRHHLPRHGRGLAVLGGTEGSLRRRARWLRPGRTHDARSGDEGAVPGGGQAAAGEGIAASLGSRGPVLCP